MDSREEKEKKMSHNKGEIDTVADMMKEIDKEAAIIKER